MIFKVKALEQRNDKEGAVTLIGSMQGVPTSSIVHIYIPIEQLSDYHFGQQFHLKVGESCK